MIEFHGLHLYECRISGMRVHQSLYEQHDRSVSQLTDAALTSAADCGFEILLKICGLLFVLET